MSASDGPHKLEVKYDEPPDEPELLRACGGLLPARVAILFPAAFAALRQRFCEGGDASFVASLRHARPWDSGHGGRSGSTFLKTCDGRFLIKLVPRHEYHAFFEHAPAYFAFVRTTPTTLPSLLVKVLGAFHVEFRSADKKSTHSQWLLVQENLFFGHDVVRMCDLKGAQRHRAGDDPDDTVVDEHLFQLNGGYPLLLSEAAKAQLTRALWNDTLFLSSINVMDYSLLVGMVQRAGASNGNAAVASADAAADAAADVDADASVAGSTALAGGVVPLTARERAEAGSEAGLLSSLQEAGREWTLVVGLIDYCRQYTWKEDAESRIKRSTVIPPKQYKRRFREALNRYFMASMEKYSWSRESHEP